MDDYRLEFMEKYRRRPSPKQVRRQKKPLPGCVRVVILGFQLAFIAVMLVGVGAIGGYFYLAGELEGAIDRVVAYQGQGAGGTPRFFDRNGVLLFELKTGEKRRWLDYDQIPVDVLQATVAVEDDTFWVNQGFDPAAIVAALVANYRNVDERPSGASTITQQLVRHIAFSYEERIGVSYERKVREIFLASILAQKRTKHDIITMYLNEIYYGNLAYGIEAASQTYFAKPAAALSLPEAAFLAALPQSPLELDPYSNFEGAKVRQEFVLTLMAEENMISVDEETVARLTPITLAPRIPIDVEVADGPLEAAHFILYAREYLEQRFGANALLRDGWQVTTSLDVGLHNVAQRIVREQVAARAANHDVSNGAVVILKPATGEILSMVGSLDYFNEAIDGQVNIALQPRQPGSAIKPVTYAAAMTAGWTTGDVIWDVPIRLDLGNGQIMVPRNYDGRYHGPILLRDALANSYNIPPIQLTRDIGLPAMISMARKMGIASFTESPGYYGLALTLGGGEVPLLELTQAYATLANGGQRPPLTPVLRIEDSRGRLVFDSARDRVPAVNAVDPRIAYILSDILSDNGARTPAMGAWSSLRLPFPAAAKTGTTNDFRDNWTVGYTPGVVVGVWLGNADGRPMRNTSGLQGAAPVWSQIMTTLYGNPGLVNALHVNGQLPPADFTRPNGIEEREVCLPRGTGGSVCTASRRDLFLVSGPTHTVSRLGYSPNSNVVPGAWTLAALPLTTAVDLAPLADGLTPPAPSRCVANTGAPPAGADVRLFLPVPPFYPDEVVARRWAQGSGYVMAPPTVCPFSAVRAAAGSSSGSEGESGGSGDTAGQDAGAPPPSSSAWRITSPTAGQSVSGLVQIVGTANFDPAQVQFYKLEIGSGAAPSAWTTFGSTHSQPVGNGVLEELHAYALPPGNYVIRLVLVANDGNFPTPHSVPITIVP